ncbi:MAG: hypothetical protein LAT54_01340 [Cryomorphaceae bacterium]|nr:hypothetical protein [Cryomorphaceae bacterium]
MSKLTKIDNMWLTYALRTLAIMCLVVIVFNILLSLIPGSLGWFFANYIPAIVASFVLLSIFILRFRYSVFQVEYEIITLRDVPLFKKLPLSGYYNGASEFPRRMLKEFGFKEKGLRKILVIKTISNTNEEKTRKLNVTFLSKSKRDKIYSILDKIKRKNEKQNNLNDSVA